ncbi:MAG: phosphatase RsbU N-terminal domain-containing protein, partial [Anaerolineaceae bacterium]
MPSDANQTSDGSYTSLLERFCLTKDIGLLAEAAILSEGFIGANVGPMDIKAIHDAAVSKLIDSNDFDALVAAHRVLLEVLVAYGVAFSAISERLLAEADAAASVDQLRSEDADRASQERLALLASVSHELGNPLMVVKVNVASIRRFLEERGSWPQELDEREEDVETAVGRMLALREELLAASRDERRELEIVPLHLERILRRVVRWGGLQASKKRIVLTEHC